MSKQVEHKNKFALLDEVQMITLRKVLRYMKRYIPLLVSSILLAMITVAMTVYKRTRYTENTIKSILKNKKNKIELLILMDKP